MNFNKIIILSLLTVLAIPSDQLLSQNTWPDFLPNITWGNMDPATQQIPAQASSWPSNEVLNHYYVDNTSPQATDDNNEFGFPDKPRISIPQTEYAAGSYAETFQKNDLCKDLNKSSTIQTNFI